MECGRFVQRTRIGKSMQTLWFCSSGFVILVFSMGWLVESSVDWYFCRTYV